MIPLKNSKPVMTIMVGLPRAGKTTYANTHKGHAVIVCADQLRYLVYNQRFWAGGEELMWSVHGIILKMLLQQGNDIIIDETNYTASNRAPLIALAHEYDYEVRAVVVSTPIATCIRRAEEEKYPRIIPFMKRLGLQYEAPAEEEGIKEIIIIDGK